MLTLLEIKSNTHKFFMGIALLVSMSSNAQINLVPNPSFEQYTNCPINTTYQGSIIGKPAIWYKPDLRGTNYVNGCTNNQPLDGIPYCRLNGGISYQYPRTGTAYLAMYYGNNNLNNYIQVQLQDSLLKDKKYYAEYYISLINTCSHACNNQSMLFTNAPVYADTNNTNFLLATPQITNYSNPIITDTMGWVKVSGIFKAQGGEQYLTLGNFRYWANTKRLLVNNSANPGISYYVDDVSVIPLDSFCLKADAGKDTTIKQGDSVFIGSYTNGIDSLLWLQNGTTPQDSTRPGFYITPPSSTFYVLHQVVNGCFSSDTVYINVQPLPLKFISYICVPSLRGTKQSIQNVWQTANEVNVSHYNIQRSINGKDFITIGKLKATNKTFNEYNFTDQLTTNYSLPTTFFYRIVAIDNDGKTTYSEIKTISFNHSNQSITIFPNPAKDYINISSKEAIKEVKLINSLGQVIKQQYFSEPTNSLLWRVGGAKGLYIVQITTTKSQVHNNKLIIH